MPGGLLALRASFTLMAALYIAPRNVQLLCHFPLGKGLSAVETVAQGEDGLLPFGEEFDEAIHLLALQAQVHIVQNVDVVGEHVAPCDAVAVLVSVDGVAEIEVMGRLLPAAKMHEDLIHYPCIVAYLLPLFSTFCSLLEGFSNSNSSSEPKRTI